MIGWWSGFIAPESSHPAGGGAFGLVVEPDEQSRGSEFDSRSTLSCGNLSSGDVTKPESPLLHIDCKNARVQRRDGLR